MTEVKKKPEGYNFRRKIREIDIIMIMIDHIIVRKKY
jgi:hypothetical protein